MQVVKKIVPTNQMSDATYRSLKSRLSYSALKTYSKSRYAFMKEHVLGEMKVETPGHAIIIGNLVHTLLAEIAGEFDQKFHLTSYTRPSGQLGELCDSLVQRSMRSIRFDEDTQEYIQQDQFTTIFADAVQQVKYDSNNVEVAFKGKNIEDILAQFTSPVKKRGTTDTDPAPENYYKECMSCIGKTVVSVNQIETAEKLVNTIKTHPYTRDIACMESNDQVQVFNELVILYQLEGLEFRSMVDKLEVNHQLKTIQPFDWKASYSVEDGFEYSYLKFSYFLQLGLYDIAIKKWAIEHQLEGYEVKPMTYVAIDTTAQCAPVCYEMTAQDVLMGQRGFSIRGKYYQGVLSIIRNINFNLESGDWTTSMDIANNQGRMQLGLKYR